MPRVKGTREMAIGRTDERHTPFIPVARKGRRVVWRSLADPIWASGHGFALKAGHMTAFEPTPASCDTYLNPPGRPHMVLDLLRRPPPGHCLFSNHAASGKAE